MLKKETENRTSSPVSSFQPATEHSEQSRADIGERTHVQPAVAKGGHQRTRLRNVPTDPVNRRDRLHQQRAAGEWLRGRFHTATAGANRRDALRFGLGTARFAGRRDGLLIAMARLPLDLFLRTATGLRRGHQRIRDDSDGTKHSDYRLSQAHVDGFSPMQNGSKHPSTTIFMQRTRPSQDVS